MALASEFPRGVRAYSTLGGTSPKSCRVTNPLRSRSRSVCVSIFCDTPGMPRIRSPLRFGARRRSGTKSRTHLLASKSITARDGHEGSHGLTLGLTVVFGGGLLTSVTSGGRDSHSELYSY